MKHYYFVKCAWDTFLLTTLATLQDPVLTWISTTVPTSLIRAVMAAHVKTTGQTSIAVNAKKATAATGVKFRTLSTVAITCGSSG